MTNPSTDARQAGGDLRTAKILQHLDIEDVSDEQIAALAEG
jgi:hypothetical protein